MVADCELRIRSGEREICVKHAQNLLARRMRMAGGVRATGLVFDGSDDAHDARAAIGAINTKAIRTIQARQRLRSYMTAVAGLGGLVEDVIYFGGIGRVADPAFGIEDSHLDHAGFVRNGLNGVVEPLAVVAQHEVSGVALDYVTHTVRAGQRGGFQVPALQSNVEISQQRKDGDHYRKQRPDQLCTDTMSQPSPQEARTNWLNLRHGLTPACLALNRFGSAHVFLEHDFLRERWADT